MLCSTIALANEAVNSEIKSFSDEQKVQIPCPFGFSVEPNPSADNSLIYLSSDETLAISVTSIHPLKNQTIDSQSYAKVAASQMQCAMPTKSNLIDKAWSFDCADYGTEAIVYGQDNEIVLLTISGRNPKNEQQLEEFVRFLAYQAKSK